MVAVSDAEPPFLSVRSFTNLTTQAIGVLSSFNPSCAEFLLKSANEVNQRHAQDPADLPKFEQIQPPRAGFVIADECLWFSESPCHVNLTETSVQPKLTEQRQECLLLFPVRREPGTTLVHSGSSIRTP